ncbi:MAG: DUF4199 domain-containing protein [Ferruginibacter sp.]
MRILSPTYKGLITGILMVLVSMLIYKVEKSFENKLQYITYAIYAAGIVWAIHYYSKLPHAVRTFKTYFSQGFKCFIVVTFIMVSFTYIFLKSDPSLKAEMATNYRTDLEKKGNLTPAEIDKNVGYAQEYFVTMFTSSAIFGYLAIGAFVTAITSLVLIKMKGPNIDQDHTSYIGTPQ